MALSLFIDMPTNKTQIESTQPLDGIKVLDFTRLLPGPLATMMMADMGAEVIKIERPDSPDYIRFFPPSFGENSAYYHSLNRSKKSLAIDYKTEGGKNILLKLIASADVLIEQFRPGVMAKMGLGYEQVKAINPKLVYVSITGYGQTGPYAQKAGHDLNYIAYSGLLGITSNKGGKPVIPGGQVADVAAGSYMALNGCLAALFAKERTGKGLHVDISMLDCVMPIASLPMGNYFANHEPLERGDLYLSGSLANYNVYECSDGRYMALGALEPKFWETFCKAVEKTEWIALQFALVPDMEKLKTDVAVLFKSEPQLYWVELGEKHDCCLSPVLDISELENNPQIQHRQMLFKVKNELGQELTTIGMPIKFSDQANIDAQPAPQLGRDNKAILESIGLSKEEIENLQQKHILKK